MKEIKKMNITKTIKSKEEFDELVARPRKYMKKIADGEIDITYDYPKNYEALIHAMKIKNRKERITYIYDNACKTIDDYNAENHMDCTFKDGRCLEKEKGGKVNGCCYRCKFQSSRGCPSKNLTCKFYFCSRFLREHKKPLTFEDFPEFKLLTKFQQEIVKTNAYCTRETFLKMLLLDNFFVFYIFSTVKVFDWLIGAKKNRKFEKEYDN